MRRAVGRAFLRVRELGDALLVQRLLQIVIVAEIRIRSFREDERRMVQLGSITCGTNGSPPSFGR